MDITRVDHRWDVPISRDGAMGRRASLGIEARANVLGSEEPGVGLTGTRAF